MRSEVAVIIPVYGRPAQVAAVHASLASARTRARCRPVFVCNVADVDAYRAATDTGADVLLAPWPAGIRGDYARKVNLGLWSTREPWLFQAATDLRFHDGWADVALELAAETGAKVVGTNDLGNPRVMRGDLSTHSLIGRDYALELGVVDAPGFALFEGYHHNFVDEELVATARARDAFAFAGDAVVEHLHPHWRKGETDDVYRLGQSTFVEDQRLHRSRIRLWAQVEKREQRDRYAARRARVRARTRRRP